MKAAFATGALASSFAAAAGSSLIIWLATVLTRSDDPWSVAPWLVPLVAGLVAVATYLAETFIHRRSMARKRSTGEPWAYRED